MTQFAVCQSCAVVLSNDDMSHLDEHIAKHITAVVESIGLVEHVAVEYPAGYWECDICSDILCGGQSEIYETL